MARWRYQTGGAILPPTVEYASFLAGMRLSPALRIGALIAGICVCVQGQNTQSHDAQIEAKGMPPRAAPADYQSQAQAGALTVAAKNKHAYKNTGSTDLLLITLNIYEGGEKE